MLDHVTLGVSGSIAAYKAAEIGSRLGKLGATVHVVMTRAAACSTKTRRFHISMKWTNARD